MSLNELETEALKLPEAERILLARRLLASASGDTVPTPNDPIQGLGNAPVLIGTSNGATDHDRYLYESA